MIRILLLAVSLLSIRAFTAEPWIITLANTSEDGKQLRLEAYEAMEILSIVGATIFLTKDDLEVRIPDNAGSSPRFPIVLVGPAKVDVRGRGWATIKITPQAVPAWRTLMLNPTTNRVAASLLISSNLVDWTSVTNLVFPEGAGPQYFRIRVEDGSKIATPKR